MFGPSINDPAGQGGGLVSAAGHFPEQWTVELDDYPLVLCWSADGHWLAALPSHGRIIVLDARGEMVAVLPGHDGGNGGIAWHPRRAALATYGQDATVRVYEIPTTVVPGAAGSLLPALVIPLEKAWAERVAWNADGTRLAASAGRTVFILNGATGAIEHRLTDHKSTVSDIVWNPQSPRELASVCDGGARLWRLGEAQPFGHFDWGGASLMVTWSPNGRWVVTGDQTPSVHLYDVRRKHPLHIQGYENKVKCLAWEGTGEWLASGGSAAITVWPCTGKKGPEGAKPIQLFGHLKEVMALDYAPGNSVLVSGGRDGLVLLWMPHRSADPALILQRPEEITCLRWSPKGDAVAVAFADGATTLCRVKKE